MSLAPVSAIAVSEMSMFVGVGLQLGREVNFLITSECLSLLGLEVIELFLKLDPCRQVAKESQPLFLVFPGPAGLEGWQCRRVQGACCFKLHWSVGRRHPSRERSRSLRLASGF